MIWDTIKQIICGDCQSDLKKSEEIIEDYEEDLGIYKAIVEDLQDQLDELTPEDTEKEEYWNNKYPKKTITYKRTEADGKYEIDVRDYFQPIDYKIPVVKGESNDDKALKALKWVHDHTTYTSDKKEYGYDEFWAYSYQTLKRKHGDCEDGAILLANIMLKSGIPYWRIRLNAGTVKGGGHAYVTYCRESDDEFVVLDWCYYYNTQQPKDRNLHRNERDYYSIWFSWNAKYAFGPMETYTGFKIRK